MSDKSEHPPLPAAFVALGVRPSVLKALAELKFETPSEIQALLIPRALAGVDLLGQARTGTGKTAAFGIPVLNKAEKGIPTQAIILVPTRELAVQVDSEMQRLAKHTPLRTVAVYGGQKITAQMKFLKHGPEILVGTPGRVIDLLDRRIINFDNIRFVILDEVDRMLDIGFRDDIRNILSRVRGVRRRLPQPSNEQPGNAEGGREGQSQSSTTEQLTSVASVAPLAPGSHQTIFVSATISPEIEKLSRQYMREPVEFLIAPGADDKPTVDKIEQFYISVQPWDKSRCLKKLLAQEKPELGIVFCRTKHGAEKLAKILTDAGFECREIHGNLNQAKRDKVMKNFRGGKFDLLIATDLASRGIDVADVTHIINYDLPEDPEVYVHRVGRTARMGKGGKAFSFVAKDQGDLLTKVESLINMIIPQGHVDGWEATPPPRDWIERDPSLAPPEPVKPTQSRFERAYSPSGTATTSATSTGEAEAPKPVMPPRTIGSKIPVNRRHKRRR